MRFLLDEMHSPAVAVGLPGLDVASVATDSSLRGQPDEEILDHAVATGRVVVTENVRDFLPLVARRLADGGSHPGLLLTHPRRFDRSSIAYPGNLIEALRQFAADPPVQGHSWTWWL